jgi:hypothetical protein
MRGSRRRWKYSRIGLRIKLRREKGKDLEHLTKYKLQF